MVDGLDHLDEDGEWSTVWGPDDVEDSDDTWPDDVRFEPVHAGALHRKALITVFDTYSIFGPTSPPPAGRLADVCQVWYRNVSALACPYRESGGYQCEVVGPHTQHHWGWHTIEHARRGNGYHCAAIDAAIERQIRTTGSNPH